MSADTGTWRTLTVLFTCRPEHRDVRLEVLSFYVMLATDRVYRPGCYERILFADGTVEWRYEASVIPKRGASDLDLQDKVLDLLTREGIVADDDAVTVR